MSDPDRIHDTEPTGLPATAGDGEDADVATTPNDTDPDDFESSSELDTDELVRWLPKMSPGHRRHSEPVRRPSSDGADFAEYTCKGPAAAASGPQRLEPTVEVRTAPRGAWPQGSKDSERDAPTVLTGERRTQRRWRRIGWSILGMAAVGAALAAWSLRPVMAERAVPQGEALATMPVAIAHTPTQSVAVAPATAVPLPVTPASPADAARTAATHSALPTSPTAADAARTRESAAAPKRLTSLARARAAPPAAAPTIPEKDQYFEIP